MCPTAAWPVCKFQDALIVGNAAFDDRCHNLGWVSVGWADEVATLAAGDRLPSISQLREMYRRQRATSAPSQQLFKSLLGLQVTPKLAREASAFWQKIREVKSISARDQIWSSILPTADELLDPEKFVSSTEIPDDLSGLL